MKILFCGDVVGRSGRDVVISQVPLIRDKLKIDLVILNGENAAGGFGITESICNDFYNAGVDVITTGNHVWDQRSIISYIERDSRLLRPLNYPKGTPGRGVALVEMPDGRVSVIINGLTRLFMDSLDNFFLILEDVLQSYPLTSNKISSIIVDLHGEATSEKTAFAYKFDGRVSLIAGTHSHIPTSDHRILPLGTAYQTDVGMCGDYNSVIGMKKDVPIERFVKQMPTKRLEAAEGEATLCAVYVILDDISGLAKSISPLRIGGCLEQYWPESNNDDFK